MSQHVQDVLRRYGNSTPLLFCPLLFLSSLLFLSRFIVLCFLLIFCAFLIPLLPSFTHSFALFCLLVFLFLCSFSSSRAYVLIFVNVLHLCLPSLKTTFAAKSTLGKGRSRSDAFHINSFFFQCRKLMIFLKRKHRSNLWHVSAVIGKFL